MKFVPPKSVLIGWSKYAVELIKGPIVVEGVEVGGYCSPTRKLIKLVRGKNDKDLVYRLLEELAHGIMDHLDIDDDPKETHHLLRQIVGEVLTFMRANPKLIYRIMEYLEND